MHTEYPAACREIVLLYQVGNRIEKFSAVYEVERQLILFPGLVHEAQQFIILFGIATEMLAVDPFQTGGWRCIAGEITDPFVEIMHSFQYRNHQYLL